MDRDEEIARALADDSPRLRRRSQPQQIGHRQPSNAYHQEYDDNDENDDDEQGQPKMPPGSDNRNPSDMQSIDDDGIGMSSSIFEADGTRRSRGRSSIGSSSAAESVNEDIKDRCRQIVDRVKSYTDKDGRVVSELFQEMVDRDELPVYYDIIKKPIALSVIEQKIDENRYSSLDDFKADLDLMWKNAFSFNQEGSEVYQDAQLLQKLANKEFMAIKSAKSGSLKIVLNRPPKSNDEEVDIDGGARRQPTLEETKELFKAGAKGDLKTIEKILSRGVDPNCYDETIQGGERFKYPLLSAIASKGHIRAAELLIQHGANVEIPDTWYQGRPLAWAAWNGHANFCRMLIEVHGANRSARNSKGQVAFDLVSNRTDPKWRGIFAGDESEDTKPSRKRKKANELEEGERPATRVKYEDDDYSMSSTSSNKADVTATPTTANRLSAHKSNPQMAQQRNGTPTGVGMNMIMPAQTMIPAGMPVMSLVSQQVQQPIPAGSLALRGSPAGATAVTTGATQQSGGGRTQQSSQRPSSASGKRGRGNRTGMDEDDRSHTPPDQLSLDDQRLNIPYSGPPSANVIENNFSPPNGPLVNKLKIFSKPDPHKYSTYLPRLTRPYLVQAIGAHSLAVANSIQSLILQIHCPNNYPQTDRLFHLYFRDASPGGQLDVRMYGSTHPETEPVSNLYEFKLDLKEGMNVYMLQCKSLVPPNPNGEAVEASRPPSLTEELTFIIQRF
ncbi:hypothetical protein SeMB42_g02959 [Synchytrium endobioticum]|uniref:Bromo domain-containing protein n=1 Tax=Synchytrium endobioticum TaxID=286115 RepID=A0A507DAW0_9FUNG|nr:hypothetical protein SeLEV6574_g03130 [Synchytrium endobioticum]TPX48521.1 hypothetical protein SeMB42_g02959 [Synchytrium endobioticum]